MACFKHLDWLDLWLIETVIFEFEWDSGNATKSLLKHKVTIQEVEEAFLGRLAVGLGIQVLPQVSEERLAIVGPTWNNRLLTIVFTLRQGRIRPISSRPSNRKENRLYEKVRKVTQGL